MTKQNSSLEQMGSGGRKEDSVERSLDAMGSSVEVPEMLKMS